MRRIAVRDQLCAGDCGEVVGALLEILGMAGRSNPAVSAALAAFASICDDDELLPYERRAELYRAASERDAGVVTRVLLQAGCEESEEEREPTRALIPRGRVLTLGERKSAARTHDPKLILHLLRDPHPAVVEILLDNPHLRETDVLTMASRRPMPGESLRCIARHPRWGSRPRLRYALAINPHTPLPLAFRLSLDLADRDLREIARTASLPALLRIHARELLQVRAR
jgi:hypothetical protein